MRKRVRASGIAQVYARYRVTGGCDTDKNIIVAAIFHSDTGYVEAREFHQHQADALRAAEWFKSQAVELVVIESAANYHLLYCDTLRAQGLNITVINPMVVKSLLQVEGKSDKGDAMTLARLAASFDLRTSNLPDSQQRELRLMFKRVDAWKVQRTQITNRTNGVLTSYGFTVFRLVSINSIVGLRILQAIVERCSPTEIAALHRTRAKRAEIEKSAAVVLPDYVIAYLDETLQDIRQLNLRIEKAEAELLGMISGCGLGTQIDLMCTVPGTTKMLALRIIAELGANYHQHYYSAEAFAKAIGVVPSNEVSGGKLLKRKASHGNKRVKFHLLSAAKAFAIHGRGPLREWFNSYRGRTTYFRATSALSRRMAEALWWVMVKNEPYIYWQGGYAYDGTGVIQLGNQLVSATTGEVLNISPDLLPSV